MTCTLEEYDVSETKVEQQRRLTTVFFSTFVAALKGQVNLEGLAVDVVFGRLIVAPRHSTLRGSGVLRHPNACLGGPGEILFHCSASTSAATSSAAATSLCRHRCSVFLHQRVSAAFTVTHTITALRHLRLVIGILKITGAMSGSPNPRLAF